MRVIWKLPKKLWQHCDSEAIKSLVKVSLELNDMTTVLTPHRRLLIWSAIKALRGETTTTTFLPDLWSEDLLANTLANSGVNK